MMKETSASIHVSFALIVAATLCLATPAAAQCSVASNCSNHASSVNFEPATSSCNCTCSVAWSGPDCGTCAPKYNQSTCADCAPGFEIFPACIPIDDGTVYPPCTIGGNCSNRASGVVNATPTNSICSCTCLANWTGASCQTCPAQYLQSTCDRCAANYGSDYPTCTYNDTCGQQDCNNRAASVSGNRSTSCNCTCRNMWTGAGCQTCPPQFNASNDCTGCARGFIDFPNCTVDPTPCTSVGDCNGRAFRVTGTRGTGCNCTCINQYVGASCETCPRNYDSRDNCGSCAPTFVSWPNCYFQCTIGNNCSGRARSVTGNSHDGCNCSCINRYTGADCSVCPPNFESSTGCVQCTPGFSGPNCQPACTVAGNCSGSDRAWDVTGYADQSCTCDCKLGWGGADCSYCAPRYTGENCDSCAPDHFNFPTCTYCSKRDNCSSHATEVIPTAFGCQCQCRNSWFGASCAFCPVQYDPFNDCAKCNLGFEGTYPNCQIGCSSFYNCSNHADRVTGGPSEGTPCTCFCRNRWEGTTCNTCPHPYDPRFDCNACLPGFAPFPNCTKLPDTPAPPNMTDAPGAENRTSSLPHTRSLVPPPSRTVQVLPSRTAERVPSRTFYTPPSSTVHVPPSSTPPIEPSRTPGPSETPPIEPSKTDVVESPTVPPTPTGTWTPSLSVSLSECAQNSSECMARNNSHVWPFVEPENCFCPCWNNWTSMWCDYCHPRFNASEDCGNCSAHYVFYPDCDYLLRVTGNWTFEVPVQYFKTLERNYVWATLARDLNIFINITLNCSNATKNVTAVIMKSFHDESMPEPKGRWFEFNVDIIDPEPERANETAYCIMDGIRVPPFNNTPPTPLTDALIASLFPDVSPESVLRLLNNSFINTTDVPYACEVTGGWCVNAAPPEEVEEDEPFPWWIIVVAIVGALLLAALLYYLLVVRPRRQHEAKYKFARPQLLKERKLSDAEALWCSVEASQQEERIGSRGTKVFASNLVGDGTSSVHLGDDEEEMIMKQGLINTNEI